MEKMCYPTIRVGSHFFSTMSDEAISHILAMSWLGDRQGYNLYQANHCSRRHAGSEIIKEEEEAPKIVNNGDQRAARDASCVVIKKEMKRKTEDEGSHKMDTMAHLTDAYLESGTEMWTGLNHYIGYR